MKLRPVSAAILLLLSGLTLAAHADDTRRPYIVQLADKPLSSYTGGVAGIAATKPAAGARLDLNTSAAQAYGGYLIQKQQAVKAVVAGAPMLYDYKVVLNGFSAMLTDDEVRALKANTAVANITADTPRQMLTNYTPGFLGLDGPNGLWSQLGGKEGAGEGVVVGIIDGGIWPENLSYADRVDANGKPTFDNSGTLAYAPLPGWQGGCDSGEGFTVAQCNNKLIGARYFIDGFKATGRALHWTEFVSPRDSIGGTVGHGGHGTHTSTTAAGNNGVSATLGQNIAMGQVSGMAPRARIASYKICWSYNDASDPTGGKNSCWGADAVAAVEQAVTDGVDVLNYSISGGTVVNDAVEQAFLHATNAGVFVAASAGNDGPANEVNHVSPWLATIAAAAHNRMFQGTATLANGASYKGASLNNTALPSSPLIRSEDAVLAGANPNEARLCYSVGANGGPTLDPAKVGGKVVTCVRGTNARVDKSLAVKQAGGVGMIMVDNGGGLVAEVHSVPTVHVTAADGNLIKAYAANPGAAAALSVFSSVVVPNAPVTAGFSSRGPNRADGNLLKPDVTAPGVDILAGVTPELNAAQRANIVNGTFTPPPAWALYQGTSMSSPHVAGVAALLRQQHPAWSPAAIKSALMTSATPTFSDGLSGVQLGTLPWAQGAGHINPNGTMVHPADGRAYNPHGASDPGLVYELGAKDYKRYQCGAGFASECTDGSVAGYNLNLPSITVNNALGTVEVTRTVTNVGASAATYSGSASLPGFNAVLSPATLTLAPNASASYTVKLTRATAPFNEWRYGDVTWTDGSHVVRVPLTARTGRAISSPALTASTRAASTVLLSVVTGFDGRMGAAVGGFKEVSRGATQTVQAILEPLDTAADVAAACLANTVGVRSIPVAIPANTVAAAFELFDRDTSSNGGDDLDLVVLNPDGSVAGSSLRGGSNEWVRLNSPSAGNYRVCVVGYAPADGVSTDFNLSSAVVTRGDMGGALKAAVPSRVYAGSVATVTASWTGLATGKRYYGGVQYLDATGAVASSTTLLVETNNPLPLAEGAAKVSRKLSAR
jgi:subtilisin family serine protease